MQGYGSCLWITRCIWTNADRDVTASWHRVIFTNTSCTGLLITKTSISHFILLQNQFRHSPLDQFRLPIGDLHSIVATASPCDKINCELNVKYGHKERKRKPTLNQLSSACAQCTAVTDVATEVSTKHAGYLIQKKSMKPQTIMFQAKDAWPRNAPYTWVGALKFSGLPDYAHGYYSQHFSWPFVLIDPMNVPTKFEVRSFTRSWDNRGYPKNLGSPRIRPRSLFSKILMGFYSDWPYMCPPNLKSIALGLPVPEIRWVAKLQTPNLEEGEAIGGWGWYCSKERW